MNDHIIFLTETEHVQVNFRDGEVELGRTQIKLAMERQVVEGVIAALCSAFGLSSDCFETKIVIRQLPTKPELGTVSLAVKLSRPQGPKLDAKDIARFCTEELVKRMDAVLHATTDMGVATPASVARIGDGSAGSNGQTIGSTMVGEASNDRGDVARRKLAEELVERLAGRSSLKKVALSSGDSRYNFAAAIPKRQRRERELTRHYVYGCINALHRKSSQVELYVEDQADGSKDTKTLMMYRSDGTNRTLCSLADLFHHPSSMKIRFDFERVVEDGPGGRIKDTLIDWHLPSQAVVSAAKEFDQPAINPAPPQKSAMEPSSAELRSVPSGCVSSPAQFAAG